MAGHIDGSQQIFSDLVTGLVGGIQQINVDQGRFTPAAVDRITSTGRAHFYRFDMLKPIANGFIETFIDVVLSQEVIQRRGGARNWSLAIAVAVSLPGKLQYRAYLRLW